MSGHEPYPDMPETDTDDGRWEGRDSGPGQVPVTFASTEADDRLLAWVREVIGRIESRPDRDSRWCERWFEHPEAVWRFAALRTAYNTHLVENALSSWWTNHFDRHAPFLFGQYGIFEKCHGADGHVSLAARVFPFAETDTRA